MNATSLLSLEIRRFLPNGTFRTLIVLYVVFFAGIFGMSHLILENLVMNVNGNTVKPFLELSEHPKNWQLLAWIGSWLNVSLLGFLGVFMITLEFQYKTLRQSVIFGMTRGEVAVSKGIFALALAATATGIYLILGILGGILAGSLSLPPVFSVAGFFLQALGYFSLGTLAGLFIRQTALAIIAYLLYTLFLETVFIWIFTLVIGRSHAVLFLPDHVLDGLASPPIPQGLTQALQAMTAWLPTQLSPLESIAAAAVYLLVFAALLHRHLQRADL